MQRRTLIAYASEVPFLRKAFTTLNFSLRYLAFTLAKSLVKTKENYFITSIIELRF